MDGPPLILDPASAGDASRLADLRASADVWRTTDTIEVQLRDLVDARSPEVDLGPDQLDAGVARILAGTPAADYGRWIHYPWSGQLVHLLPQAEFRELRLDRNRYKITPSEAERLAGLSIGIAGLSVGNAIALTLALEGAFGRLRLADHDRLDLSNMNRVRAATHDIGVPKTVLAARQIWEIDPYASIELMDEGVTLDNVDAFLDGLDIVIDECDSLALKFLIRERARVRRLPVLMETSDRGMLDVERFDLEPDRPLFHGLVGDLTSADVRSLDVKDRTTKERKGAIVLRILDAGMISTRLAASMLEVDGSLSTWPQLGGDVVLGGASAAVAVRAIAAGLPLPSGRRYVDLESVLASDGGVPPPPAIDAVLPSHAPPLGLAHPGRTDEVPALVRDLVAAAVLAPSGGNVQPWHFYWGDDRLWVARDAERARNVFDRHHHATWLALGAAVENIAIAAAARGFNARVEPFPTSDVAAAISLDDSGDDPLGSMLPLVERRRTDRRRGPAVALPAGFIEALHAAAASHAAPLEVIADVEALAEVGRIIGASDRIRFLNPLTHRGLVAELRWTAEAAAETRDGIAMSSLALDAGPEAAIHVIARPDVAAALRAGGLGARLEEGSRDAIVASSAVGMLSVGSNDADAWIAAGRGLQRLWLEATRLGVSMQPLTALIYMAEVVADGAELFRDDEAAELRALEARLFGVFRHQGSAPALLFRLALVEGEAERSPRLPVEWVLSAGLPSSAGGRTIREPVG